jgi:glycosyltransferase involved in cell wall biosynthesis
MQAFDCMSAMSYQEYREFRGLKRSFIGLFVYINTNGREKVLATFDASIVVSDERYHAMKMLCPEARCIVIPLGADTGLCKPQEISEYWSSLIFVGYMSTPPNLCAMQYFHSQVYDVLKRRFPVLKLLVVDQNPSPAIRAVVKDQSICVTGFVEDVRAYVARASVVIASFVLSTGTKNKVLKAMTMGKPVVTTSIGVRGVNATHGDHICIAGSLVKFGDEVQPLLLCQAKRRRIVHQAREFVKKHHACVHNRCN